MIDELLKDTENRMSKTEEATQRELLKIRTGKATTGLLDNIKVDYYGSVVPIAQVANIGVPEARMLTIQPWEKNMLPVIEKAILQSDLGITPSNDGTFIRLPIPLLTQERRMSLVKMVHKLAEEGKISIRNTRRDAIQKLKAAEKSSKIREDERYRAQEEIQQLTDQSIERIDEMVKHKEIDIMEI